MQDDETRDEDEAPAADAPAEEAPAIEEAPAEEAPAVEESPAPSEQAAPPDEAPGDEPAADAEEVPVEEAPAEEPALEEEPAAEEPAGEEEPAAGEPAPAVEPERDRPERKRDEAPGANLEPILLEDERELSAEERARLEAEQEERERLEAAATADGGDEPAPREGAKLDLPSGTRIQATGKRKTSIARVVVVQGAGEIQVNKRSLEEYFPRSLHQIVARQALTASGYEGQVDVKVRVHGGGVSGQADAVRHGIARALIEIDPELRGELKRRGMLTRDAREKERRKAGLKKARKRPQFSKR